MYNNLTLVLGGARSGKSSHAEKMASKIGSHVLYVATAQIKDSEMQARIRNHQKTRPKAWETLESPLRIGKAIPAALQTFPADVVLVDCLTLFVSNSILEGLPEYPSDEELDQIDENKARERLTKELDSLLEAVQNHHIQWIIVSNELGLGLVPPYHLGRIYRDLLGWANQRIAAVANQVIYMIAGLPLDVKSLALSNDILE